MMARIVFLFPIFIILNSGSELKSVVVGQEVSVREIQEASMDDNDINKILKYLWSADKRERKTAKERLIGMGPRAIPPLIALLRDILSNPGPRYSTDEASVSAKNTEMLTRHEKLEISNRLKEDAIDLLVRLQSEEAVELFVIVMLQDISNSGMGRGISLPGTQALLKLGRVAVPKLLEILETPDAITDSLPLKFQASDEQKQKAVRSRGPLIQILIASVLGEIGDARALAVLEKLSISTHQENVFQAATEAINQIREKTK